MPKMKTKSGAKKRFKMTASGRVKAGVVGETLSPQPWRCAYVGAIPKSTATHGWSPTTQASCPGSIRTASWARI